MIYKQNIIATSETINNNEVIITDNIAITSETSKWPLVFIQLLLHFEINMIELKINKVKCTC